MITRRLNFMVARIHESSFEQAWELIDKAQRLLLVAHKKPDGDTMGSITAMMNYCMGTNKDAVAYCRDVPAQSFTFLPLVERIANDVEAVLRLEPYDVAVIFDSGDLQYAGGDELIAQLTSTPTILNIDHHYTNTRYGDVNIVVEDAASTTEVIAHFFQHRNVAIDRNIATCLLTGLVTDTGAFSNPATSVSALQTASRLLEKGAKFSTVIRNVIAHRSVDGLRLWALALERLEIIESWQMAVTVIAQEDEERFGAGEDAKESLANFLNSLTGVRAALVLREIQGNRIKGSLRTTRDDVDVSRLAQFLGGGGHKKAAGFTIDGRLEQRPDGHWQVV